MSNKAINLFFSVISPHLCTFIIGKIRKLTRPISHLLSEWDDRPYLKGYGTTVHRCVSSKVQEWNGIHARVGQGKLGLWGRADSNEDNAVFNTSFG